MAKLITTIALLITTSPVFVECNENKMLQTQIQKNLKCQDKQCFDLSKKLSIIIQKKANKHGVSPNLLSAILMQESRYQVGAVRCNGRSSHISKRKYSDEKSLRSTCSDFGMSQIHRKTIKAFSFNTSRLVTEKKYSIEAGAIVLSDFKRMYGKKEPKRWWSRYNSSTPMKRRQYERSVKRFLNH